jgi:MoaA/NifB/PqqE/SkfB family radical SAM enzyme
MFEGILDVVSTARELGMLVSMGTNGVLVPDHDAVIDQLDSLVVSVDGPRDITDRQRFPGAFDAALKAIEVARSKGVGAMVTTVVTRDSADEIERILEWARRDGLNMNLQLPFHPPGYSGQDNGGQLPTAEQIRRVVHLVMAPEYAATVVINSSEYWKRVSHWCIENADVRELSPRSGSWFTTCRGGQLFGHLEPDGRYYPCANLVGSFPARMVDARESDIAVSLATAVRHASRRTCGSCLSTYAFEQNLLFNLFPHSVARWTREILS